LSHGQEHIIRAALSYLGFPI
ncbi:DUF4916 domain-containing protein, partial [Geobacillus sp. MMMUD3]|nr:DUF4916 domain-containing protein [Geobacillus sp. MMMUD3]